MSMNWKTSEDSWLKRQIGEAFGLPKLIVQWGIEAGIETIIDG